MSTVETQIEIHNDSSLLVAASNGWFEDLVTLIKSSQNCRAEIILVGGWNQSTALHLASHGGHLQIVQFLHQHGQENIDCTNTYGDTPLLLAAEQGYVDVASYFLLSCGASLDKKNSSGFTPQGNYPCITPVQDRCE